MDNQLQTLHHAVTIEQQIIVTDKITGAYSKFHISYCLSQFTCTDEIFNQIQLKIKETIDEILEEMKQGKN